MANIKAVYLQSGLVVGDLSEDMNTGDYIIKKPVMLSTRKEGIALIPFLEMMEEDSVTVKPSEVNFGAPFTPVIDIVNHYNQMYGSGIVTAPAGSLSSGGIALS